MKHNRFNQQQEYSNTGYAPNIQATTGSYSVAVTVSQTSGQLYSVVSSPKNE